MYLESERMLLRDYASGDLAELHEIFGNADVMVNTEPPYDRAKTERFLHGFCIECKGAFAAFLKETGRLIGYVLFKGNDESVFEIGWIFNKHYWCKGYAFEICQRLVNHALTDMGAHKICAEAIDEDKSVLLMKKLGMLLEGVQRKHTRDNQGNWRDLHWYTVLEEGFFAPH